MRMTETENRQKDEEDYIQIFLHVLPQVVVYDNFSYLLLTGHFVCIPKTYNDTTNNFSQKYTPKLYRYRTKVS